MAFDTIDLMQRDEIATEILNRPRPAVVVWEDDDGHLRIMQSFFPESDPRSKCIAAIKQLLRQLADGFDEGSEYHPAELRRI